jgi:hypothetical protein
MAIELGARSWVPASCTLSTADQPIASGVVMRIGVPTVHADVLAVLQQRVRDARATTDPQT